MISQFEKSQLEHPYRDNIENRKWTPRINALSIQQNIISFEIEDLFVQLKLPHDTWLRLAAQSSSLTICTLKPCYHGKSPLLQTRRTCIATHMIFNKKVTS